MADPRTSFTILEDSSSQAGLPLHKALEGDAIASINAHGALVAKNGTNFAYLKVDPSTGALLVTDETAGVCLKAKGETAAGSATLVVVTGATITLAVSMVYNKLGFLVSCRRDALFQIIWNNGGVETILGEIVVGSGAYTVSSELHCLQFTSGAVGTQELKLKAMNFEALSSLRGSLTVEEVQ